MTKKLIFAGTLTVALATLVMIAETVSADYYDCNGNLKAGDPSPSECHYFLAPQRTTSSNTSYDRKRAEIVTSTGSSSTSSTTTSTSTTGRSRANIITEIGRNYSELEEARNAEDAIIVNDPEDYSKKYEKRNARKYCVRDYCYIVYDYCYDLTHCEQKVDKIPRDEYGTNWQDIFEDYWNDYFRRPPYENCRPQTGRCVYRGFYFGGFHNGYWYY